MVFAKYLNKSDCSIEIISIYFRLFYEIWEIWGQYTN